jgi:hypothetical protein
MSSVVRIAADQVAVGDSVVLPGAYAVVTKTAAGVTGDGLTSLVILTTQDAGVLVRGVKEVLDVVKATVAPAPAPTPAPAPVSTLPKADLPGWKIKYAEDFTTPFAVGAVSSTGVFPTAYPSMAAYNDGWQDTSKKGYYYPTKTLSCHDSVLDIAMRTDSTGKPLVCAPWVKATKGQTYGRYAIRFKADSIPGYKIAWLLWPDSEVWPADGEIDFPECNLTTTSKANAFMHYALSTGGQDGFPGTANICDGQWHTAIIEWSPGRVVFTLDDKVLGIATKSVPSKPMHWVIQCETNLDGAPIPASSAGHILVDWLAVWTYAP